MLDKLVVHKLDPGWVKEQISTLGFSIRERQAAERCLGAENQEAWSPEEAAFLGGLDYRRTLDVVDRALKHIEAQVPVGDREMRGHLACLRDWLFEEVN